LRLSSIGARLGTIAPTADSTGLAHGATALPSSFVPGTGGLLLSARRTSPHRAGDKGIAMLYANSD